jgi:hypothetical protein
MTPAMYSASNAGSKYARNPSSFANDQNKLFNQTANEHSTMMEMAADTGGKAFVNTNGLKEAVDKAVAAGSNYYTLTYTPTNKNWNGDYRKIEIKMGAPGYTLEYRRGYYADDPDAPPTKKNADLVAATAAASFNPMAVAMIWGGPDPTEILFTADVLPVTGEPEPAVADGVQLQPKVSGPFKRYIVAFSAHGPDIRATSTPDGGHHINVEFVTFVYNSDGALIASQGRQIAADVNDAHFKAMQKAGVQYRQEISVPVKGEYFLRIGVHDLTSDKVGALEVPVDSVSHLKSLQARVAEKAAAQPAAPATSPAKQ